MEVERPRRADPRRPELRREHEPPHDRGREQRPGDDAAGTGAVPPQLAGHDAISSSVGGGGEPAASSTWCARRRWSAPARRRRGARAARGGSRRRGRPPSPAPRRATPRWPPLTAVSTVVHAVVPVSGSMRWWRASPSGPASGASASTTWRRRPRPARRPRAAAARGARRAGRRSRSASHPRGAACPSTRTSPPMFTQAPTAPRAISSPATMSAARPLPMPPGSKPTPKGNRTAPPSSSSSISAAPADRLDRVGPWRAAKVSKLRS